MLAEWPASLLTLKAIDMIIGKFGHLNLPTDSSTTSSASQNLIELSVSLIIVITSVR